MPMQNLSLFAELKAWGVCPCKIYYFDRTQYIGGPVCTGTCMGARPCGRPCSCPCRVAWTMRVQGRGERVRGASHRVLHLLRYCATLARPGTRATAFCGRWDLALTP